LGLGYATLVPQTGKEAITVTDVGGVQIAGLIIDAGPLDSPVLLKMSTGVLTGNFRREDSSRTGAILGEELKITLRCSP
jgi:hypothetical protein